jgi:hypothetical protein
LIRSEYGDDGWELWMKTVDEGLFL